MEVLFNMKCKLSYYDEYNDLIENEIYCMITNWIQLRVNGIHTVRGSTDPYYILNKFNIPNEVLSLYNKSRYYKYKLFDTIEYWLNVREEQPWFFGDGDIEMWPWVSKREEAL